MSFQDLVPPSASEEHQLYDMDQPPAHHSMHGTGPPGGHSQDMRFHSSRPQDGNFGSFGHMDGPGGAATTQMSGSDIALQWQQGHYMGANNPGGESGFVSGAETGPPSQVGHDDLEGDGGMGFNTGPGSITGSSLYDLDSAHPSEVSSIQSNASGFQNPDELIPRCINFLIDEDPQVVLETLILVEKCAKRENFFNVMIRSFEFVNSIVQALVVAMNNLNHAANALAAANNANESGTNTPNDGSDNPQQKTLTESLDRAEKQTRHASNILRNMTNSKDPNNKQQMDNQMVACHNILRGQGIPPITALLLCQVDRIKFNAVATIHSLLLCLDQNPHVAEPAKQQIRESGGVETMIELLKTDNVKLLTILTDCLRILATKNQQTKDAILARNGPAILVDIMNSRHHDYRNLILMTTRLLKVLSCCPKSKRVIIEAGGMEALSVHLSSDQPKIIMNCLLTMRNMSDLASGIPEGEVLCQDLVQKLRYPEPVIVSCATSILANLTANNERLKLAVCKANGVTELVRLIDSVPLNNRDGKDILESSLFALRHLTNNHSQDDTVQRIFVFELGGLSILNRHLNPDTNRQSLKAILQCFRNLLLKSGNHEAIKREMLPQKIMQMLVWAMRSLEESKGANVPLDNVRLTEIVEYSLSCVSGFSKEKIYNDIIRDSGNIRLFKGILTFFAHEESKTSIDNIIRLTAGIIEAISSDDMDGAYIVFREGLEEAVIRLSNHSNQKIAQFAATIMHNLATMKHQEQAGNFHPSKHLQQPHTHIQNPNLQNIPPPGGNGFGQGPNQQGIPQHMQPGGPQGYNSRNHLPPLQQQGQMSNNPGFDQMMADPGMHGAGPGGQAPQMPIGQRDTQKQGGGYHQVQGPPQRSVPPDGRMGGPPGYVDDMSMEMGHMNVTTSPYNPNFPEFFDGSM